MRALSKPTTPISRQPMHKIETHAFHPSSNPNTSSIPASPLPTFPAVRITTLSRHTAGRIAASISQALSVPCQIRIPDRIHPATAPAKSTDNVIFRLLQSVTEQHTPNKTANPVSIFFSLSSAPWTGMSAHLQRLHQRDAFNRPSEAAAAYCIMISASSVRHINQPIF